MTDNYEQKGRAGASWGPLVGILIIVTVVFAVIDNSTAFDQQIRQGESTFSDMAFLGGVVRKYDASAFRQGKAGAFMGGVDLDFRDATIEGDEAKLDITAVMGGVKVRVPRTWNVDNQVTTVMGGMKDRTHSNAGNKRLVIKGAVLMGGLDILN
jgi:predicted membrane protein